jgi:N-methylhydantoinase A/oxoprolinase/acetone carboxylase beta subunit
LRSNRVDKERHPTSETVPAPYQTRDAYFAGVGHTPTAFYLGSQIRPGFIIDGPAVILEPAMTIVIPPAASAQLSNHSNYMISTGC